MSTDRAASPNPKKLWLIGALVLIVVLGWLGLRPGDGERAANPDVDSTDEAGRERVSVDSPTRREGAEPTGASGRVRSREGEAIADAVVTLAPLGDDRGLPLTARSDASGEWSITAIEPGRYALSATAAGFLAGLRPELTLRAGDNPGLDVRLERGGNLLSGVVSDATGGVIESALVQVTPQTGIVRMRERDSYFTLTDAEGRYALQIPDGRHRVRASHLDYASEQVVLELAGSPAQRDFALVPTAVIEGIVRRESDGEPVAHAEVEWSRAREQILPGGDRISIRERGGRVIADGEGRFRIRGLPPGVVELSARASQLVSESGVEVVVGIAERVEEVELWLSAAADVHGRVVAAADGEPIEGASVELFGPGLSATTDATGQFEIRGVLPGPHRLLASAEGFQMNEPLAIEVGVGVGETIELALERGLMIRGRVEPASLAEVAIELRPENLRMGGGRFSLSGLGAATTVA
jgi:protocatechuate 3,4-dioxygenase beta subunit